MWFCCCLPAICISLICMVWTGVGSFGLLAAAALFIYRPFVVFSVRWELFTACLTGSPGFWHAVDSRNVPPASAAYVVA